MKYIYIIIIAAILLLPACADATPQTPEPPAHAPTAAELVADMRLGWNLGNTMDVVDGSKLRRMPPGAWEMGWGNPETTPELFQALYDSGFNVFRIPVSWNDHLMLNEDWKIVDDWMERVKEIVDYAYDTGAYVIINTHHESWSDPYYDNQERASQILARIWTQVAEVFADYDERLIFEGLNEPRKVGTPVEWNGGDQEGWDVINHLNAVFVDTVRAGGGYNPWRVLMITTYAANAWEAPKHLAIPENDERIVVSMHAYEPYEFALKVDGRGLWNNDTDAIDRVVKLADELFVSQGIPVILGEFGAMSKTAATNESERAAWAEYYVGAAATVGIPCIWWDNGQFGGSGELFGLIDRKSYDIIYPLVLEGLLKGAGL